MNLMNTATEYEAAIDSPPEECRYCGHVIEGGSYAPSCCTDCKGIAKALEAAEAAHQWRPRAEAK
jgi:predicted Zn-ribbon and HTH transcriptional regulator